MNIIHLLFIFHKRNVKFCFVKKKYKKISWAWWQAVSYTHQKLPTK